jgi:3-deoxy-D-manno-octulosonate 8-phosphate phosphatase (KDO 8-P phosphatase)
MSRVARRRLRAIRALVLDVDGVLTDGSLYYGPGGQVFKRFNVKDGMGIRLVQEAGIAVAFLSAEETAAVKRRARTLKVRHVFLGVEDKLRALDTFLARQGLEYGETAYVGDDVNDLGPLGRVGLAVAPADAAPQARRAAHWVTERRGGEGAVREVCDALLAGRSGA